MRAERAYTRAMSSGVPLISAYLKRYRQVTTSTASAAGGDLWRLRRVRLLGVGSGDRADLRRVLELTLIALRHRLERREILAAHRGTHRELLRERIHGMAGAIEFVVQVRTGRHAGCADEADHLALAQPAWRPVRTCTT